jgi:hypothetical protein
MMEWTADNQRLFFAVWTRLIGPEVNLMIEAEPTWQFERPAWAVTREIADAVKTAVPDAASRQAGRVLEH